MPLEGLDDIVNTVALVAVIAAMATATMAAAVTTTVTAAVTTTAATGIKRVGKRRGRRKEGGDGAYDENRELHDGLPSTDLTVRQRTMGSWRGSIVGGEAVGCSSRLLYADQVLCMPPRSVLCSKVWITEHGLSQESLDVTLQLT